MSDSFQGNKLAPQGYVYNSFGSLEYLKQAVASVSTLRRYDSERAVALFCSKEHKKILDKYSLEGVFSHIFLLPDENLSITGFKHNVYKFMPFRQNLFVDADIIWCKSPDSLWKSFSAYRFTITGNQTADIFFGGPKGISIVGDILLRRRNRTLKRFGLTYLSRVQSGMIYAQDSAQTKEICELAGEFLKKKHLTHFRSRTEETGRREESCEWSLAMAMAKLKIPVYPWLQGDCSPQLDFIESYTRFDEDFNQVRCLLYSDRFVYDLKAIRFAWLRKGLIGLFSLVQGKGDHLHVTPYCLHFGWFHQKAPFMHFSEKIWKKLTS